MDSVQTLVNKISAVFINPAILLVFGAALLLFVWGLIQFLWALNVGGKDSNIGKQHMLWGAVGMFVMVAAWGIFNLIQGTVNSIR